MAKQVATEVGQETVTEIKQEVREVVFTELVGLLALLQTINPVEVPVRYAIMGETGQVLSTLPAERYKAIIERTNEEHIYGVVSQRYTLINHKDLMERIVPHLQAVGLHHVDTYVTGGKMFSKWQMKHYEQVKVGDLCGFGLLIRNSIDGSMALGVDFWMLRLNCLNGACMSLGLPLNNLRHMGVELDRIEDIISKAVEALPDLLVLMQNATKTELTAEQMRKAYDTLNLPQYIKGKPDFTPPLNVWYAYNNLTYSITRSEATMGTKFQYWNEAERLLREALVH